MSERIKRLYESGDMTDAMLDKAVRLGWISSEEAAVLKEARTE